MIADDTAAPVRAVADLALELEVLVDELTRESKTARDDGTLAPVAPLLAAAEDALTARDRPGGGSLASHRDPARLGAVELLADVDRTTARHRRPGRDRLGAVRAWAAAAMGDPHALEAAVEAVNRWTTSARALLEPRRVLPIRGALCPACGARDVRLEGDQGEVVIGPTLVADVRLGTVSCRAEGCGAGWPADALEHLARVLDQQSAETLAGE